MKTMNSEETTARTAPMKPCNGILGVFWQTPLRYAAALVMAAALAAPTRAAETPAKGGAKVAFSATADLVAAENAHLRIEFSRKDGVMERTCPGSAWSGLRIQ